MLANITIRTYSLRNIPYLESSKEDYFPPKMNKLIFLKHLVCTLIVIAHRTHFLVQTVQWNFSGAVSFGKSHLKETFLTSVPAALFWAAFLLASVEISVMSLFTTQHDGKKHFRKSQNHSYILLRTQSWENGYIQLSFSSFSLIFIWCCSLKYDKN